MNINVKSSDSEIYYFPSDLDIRAAVSLQDALSTALDQSDALLLDASKVERLSTPCVQIIISAMKSLENEGRSFRIVDATPQFVEFFDELGFATALEQWSAADG